jgi:hypothetical protein
MTLLGTLTTTSGTTQSLTDIAAGYRQLYCEVNGVSFSATRALGVELSSTNGAAYGTAVAVSGTLGTAAGTLDGWLTIGNISSTITIAKTAYPCIRESSTGTIYSTATSTVTNTAAVVNAIRFILSGAGNFDAGTILVYGVK